MEKVVAYLVDSSASLKKAFELIKSSFGELRYWNGKDVKQVLAQQGPALDKEHVALLVFASKSSYTDKVGVDEQSELVINQYRVCQSFMVEFIGLMIDFKVPFEIWPLCDYLIELDYGGLVSHLSRTIQ